MSKRTTSEEIERKFELPDAWVIPPLAAAGVVAAMRRGRALTLTAVYYDTTDLRLARQRITLRRRTGGHDDGWHLKLPTGHEHTRTEVHLPLHTPGEPPDELVRMVAGHTRGAPLAAVARLVNDRRPTVLVAHDGAPLAEITDDHVTVERDGRVVETFREVEVEAAPGRTLADLAPVVAALLASGAHPSSFASKAVRALGPAAAGRVEGDGEVPPSVG